MFPDEEKRNHCAETACIQSYRSFNIHMIGTSGGLLMEKKTKAQSVETPQLDPGQRVTLAGARIESGVSVESALARRRSVREYSSLPLTLAEVGQLVWAAQGVTGSGGLRTAPSAGAIYPLRLYVLAGAVEGLQAGIFGYDPDANELEVLSRGDKRQKLFEATCEQVCSAECAMAVLLAGWFTRATREFGPMAQSLALIEAGHAAQNLLLQATALGLGAMGLGKFDREAVARVFHLPASQQPLYLLLAGHPV